MINLNILDYSPVDEGKTPGKALWETTQLAQIAEKLGYKRFWVPEHHHNFSLAVSSPEMVIDKRQDAIKLLAKAFQKQLRKS